MAEHIENQPNNAPRAKDCGCGCNGNAPCDGAAGRASKARRALMLGAGSAAVIVTLSNRRAFATGAECSPVSHAASLNPSQHGQQQLCGGVTPGFWRNHKTCVVAALGGSDPTQVTLGAELPNLNTVDPGYASQPFATALCNPSSAAYHWACAILNSLTPQINPNYGYSSSTLNTAILDAYHAGVSPTNILDAFETLENDYMTDRSVSCAKANDKVC
jgi:hypothetical protein